MKRALLVAAGTVTGLAAVLSYSDGAPVIADLASTAGPVGLGPSDDAVAPTDGAAPAPAAASASASPRTSPSTKASPKPSRSASSRPTPSATPTSTRSATVKPSPTPTRSTARPKPTTSSPKPTTSPTPKPKPTPTPTPTPALPNGDFIGSVVTHRYGPVQVGIHVTDGVITKAWAVQAPSGSSTGYTSYSVPKLSAETVGTKTAQIAIVSGATLTSKAWITSLAAAMAKAGI